ncbi:MAG: hypothetical protein ACM34K_18580 [Bacillota bacterium]
MQNNKKQKQYGPETILLVCLLAFSCWTSVQGKTYDNKDSHFSITVPADWVQIPKDSIKNVKELKKAGYEDFDYLYKIKDAGPLFEYPYILIQVIKPNRFSDHRNIAGLADWKLEKVTQSYLLKTMDDKFYLEKSTGRVWQKSGLMNMNRISVFFPKGYYSYNVFFFSRKEDLEKYLPAFFNILNSIKEEKPELLVLNYNKHKLWVSLIAAFIGLISFITYQKYPASKK